MAEWAEGTKEKRDGILARYPDRSFGKVRVERSLDFTKAPTSEQYDWQAQVIDVIDLGWFLSMDHQCDEFEIGGPDDARQLISDLQAAIDYCLSFD